MGQPRKRTTAAIYGALAIILVVAAVVRFWGIGFGLPHVDCRPDETLILRKALAFGSGDLNPHFFRYPSLHMYALFGLFVGYFLIKMALGQYSGVSDLIIESSITPTNFYLIGRCLSAILGAATVFVVYRIARRLLGEKVAILSSLFLSLAYLHVRDSHFAVTDVPLTFLVACSVLLIVRSWEVCTPKAYMWAGLVAGLATSTKYTAAVLIIPMLVVHYLNTSRQARPGLARFVDGRLLLFGSALILAFFAGTPFALVDRRQFVSDVLFEMDHLSRGHLINLGIGWWYHLRYSLFYGMGWSLLLAAAAGIVLLAKTDARKAAVLCSFPLFYYVLIGKGYTVFLRYAVPLVPFLCITAAVFVSAVHGKLARRFTGPVAGFLTSVLIALLLLPSFYSVVRFSDLISRTDNRLVATEWVEKNIMAGSSLGQFGSWAGKLQLHPTVESLEAAYERRVAEGGSGRTIRAKIDYLRREGLPGYDEWTYDSATNEFRFNDEEQSALPDYIIVERSPLVVYSRVLPDVEGLIRSLYSPVASFEAIDVSDSGSFYDQQDAFYLPFVGFSRVERPGPNLYVYARN